MNGKFPSPQAWITSATMAMPMPMVCVRFCRSPRKIMPMATLIIGLMK